MSEAKKILVVEDDALLAKLLTEALMEAGFAESGYKVKNIANGLKVREAVQDFGPDIILLDLILPGLDGFAVLKQLKSEDKTKDVPVVIISNLGDAADIKSAKALGAEEYFIKANTQLVKIVDFVKKIISL